MQLLEHRQQKWLAGQSVAMKTAGGMIFLSLYAVLQPIFMSSNLQTPVLFLIFNRPSTTQVVFEAIRKARPSKLYVAADGPRANKSGESEKCLESRTIATSVDWDCKVVTLFREGNLGCGKAISSAITWFFQQEEEGIILEDDCLPSPDFFPFCAELLERYRYDTRIMQIGGVNLVPKERRDTEYSYYYSNHNNIWGWATWKRAWMLYDYEMSSFEKIYSKGYFENHFNSIYEADYFDWAFKRTSSHPHITWDYQLEFARRINSGLTICPQPNLVTNIGFGSDATHTTGAGGNSSRLELEQLEFPLRHPAFVMVDTKSDDHGFILHHTSLKSRIKSATRRMLPPLIRKKIFET